MKIVKADKKGIELALRYLKAGKAVVYPTDTSYGLGVDATNVEAVRRLYKIKERKFNQPVHVIVQNFAAVKKLAIVAQPAKKLFMKFLPGPLTLILSRKGRGKAFRLLSAGTGTIGIRVPDNKIALQLVKKLGRPITTPSANPSAHLSGGTTPYSVQDSFRQFLGKKFQPDLYLDAGKLPKRAPSTIVTIEHDKIKILRKGPISQKQIFQCLN